MPTHAPLTPPGLARLHAISTPARHIIPTSTTCSYLFNIYVSFHHLFLSVNQR